MHHTVSLSKQCTVPLAPKAPLPSSKYLSAVKNISSYILLIIIATLSDIELNPGPPQIKYPCGTCGKAVTWRQKGIRCDNPDCEKWYHIACQNMRPTIYEHMNSSNCVWECLQCALPNYSSSLFDLHSISTSNSFSNLDSSTEDSQEVLSPGLPLASSSPHKKQPTKKPTIMKPLRIINVNCQSLSNKKEDFERLLDSTKADVVFGTESWLGSNIKDHEVFPDGYTVYRKDRTEGKGGGVFIAVKDHYVSSHMADFDTDCEILWVKLEIASCRSLFLAAYYRPNANDAESLSKLNDSLEKLPNKNSHIWSAGDMNLPGINWPSGSMKSNCPSPSQHSQFLDILADHGLVQITDNPLEKRMSWI